ncbi:type II toxin-antitoxin system HicA family toxin [Gloeocapsopsis sp. IPPAS B-1203]|nr:type II toxin-antitoxin system HicA family toxin [Gloeocapsopsis sp. IPPAS B-1203]
MKRRDLIKKIEEMGCVFIRHGGKHDWYQNPQAMRGAQYLKLYQHLGSS